VVDLRRVGRPVSPAPAGRWDAIAVGVFAFAIGVARSGQPSFWQDEAATISATTRSLGQLWGLLGQRDAVHGLHNLLMHFWFQIVPPTEFWSRLPSAVAVGLACAGVVVLGRQLSTRSFAVAAGIALAVLPRSTWAAVEARSYALSMCAAVWLTVLCVQAARRGSAVLWIGYAVGLAFTTSVNVLASLVLLPHAVLVVTLVMTRRAALPWVLGIFSAGLAMLPLAAAVQRQKMQVDWILPVGSGSLGAIVHEQYFPAVNSVGPYSQPITDEQFQSAVEAGLLVAPYFVVLLVLAAWAIRNRGTADALIGAHNGLLVRTGVTWVLGPTLVVILYSLVREPIYVPRYLTFTAPGVALLIAWSVVVAGRDSRRIATILIVLGAAAVPNYLAQRGPHAKLGMDFSQVGDLLAARAAPGDCLNIDTTAARRMSVHIKASKPEAFGRLRDPGELLTAPERTGLHELRVPITAWADRLSECTALWSITDRDSDLPAHDTGARLAPGAVLEDRSAYLVPTARGFGIVERWQFNLTQVLRSVRGPDAAHDRSCSKAAQCP
jgi:mannosyltransferase